jgi:hypothetical protein
MSLVSLVPVLEVVRTVEQWSAGRGPIKPGFGLDGVEKPSPAMKDFDLFDFEQRAKSQRPANCQLLFAF